MFYIFFIQIVEEDSQAGVITEVVLVDLKVGEDDGERVFDFFIYFLIAGVVDYFVDHGGGVLVEEEFVDSVVLGGVGGGVFYDDDVLVGVSGRFAFGAD